MKTGIAVVLLLAGSWLSGCYGPPPPTGISLSEGFEVVTPGLAPQGWTSTSGAWAVEVNATAIGGYQVMRGTGNGSVGRTHLVSDSAGVFGDFRANVSFMLLSGDHPQGAGLTFRFSDTLHYFAIRYSTSEGNWHLFVANGGDAEKIGSATVRQNASHPILGQWVRFQVEVSGDHVQGVADGISVIDYTVVDGSMPKTGKVGLFLRGETVALFDDFNVRP